MAEAKQAIAAVQGVPKFALNAPRFDASKAKGKTIFAIPIASTDEFAASIDSEMKQISAQLGVHFVEFNNQGSPTEWASGINQAIAQKAGVIVLTAGGDPALILPQLKRAKAAGIPAIITHYYQSGEVPPPAKSVMAGFIQGTFHEAGKLMADYAFIKMTGKPHPLIIQAAEAAPSAGMVRAIKAELKHLCPSCQAPVINVPVADWPTKMPSAVQSALTADANINYVLPLYDSMSIGAQAGIVASGKGSTLKIASYNGTPAVLKLIKPGSPMQMDVGESISWIAYAAMDQALRLLSGVKPLPDTDNNEGLPQRIFDTSNLGQTGNPPQSGQGYGNAYAAGYRKLWGLGG